MNEQEKPKWLQELYQKANPNWLELLENPGGATILIKELPSTFSANLVAEMGTDERRIWELIGLFYRANQRWYDAIAVYTSMYYHFINHQLNTGIRVHKGMPLVWLAECFLYLGFATLSKRYLMLTLIEDAISMEGRVDPIQTGSYFRLAWRHGFTDNEINRYSQEAFELSKTNPKDVLFTEWVLQEFDQDWIVEVPGTNEASYYITNPLYVKQLIDRLGESTGKTLERLAEYLLSCMPGCKTSRRSRTKSTDYDVVGSLEGPNIDFRSELGRYFLVECKDWKVPVDFSTFAKFCRVLDSVKAHFGIIFSKHGITGEGKDSDAEREQLKVFQDRGTVIIVVNEADLEYVANGGNMVALLKKKYEKVRLDLRVISTKSNAS